MTDEHADQAWDERAQRWIDKNAGESDVEAVRRHRLLDRFDRERTAVGLPPLDRAGFPTPVSAGVPGASDRANPWAVCLWIAALVAALVGFVALVVGAPIGLGLLSLAALCAVGGAVLGGIRWALDHREG